MSQGLISRSPDLQRLRDEGFDVAIQTGYLVLRAVPYVKSDRSVGRGTLVSTLDLSGDRTAKPSTHVTMWTGEFPCDSKGAPLTTLGGVQEQHLSESLVVQASFSQKPGDGGYADYYQKMTSYARILEGHAHVIDPAATARTYPVITTSEDESVFCYLDTASSRAGIAAISQKLQRGRVTIVGLGGTGAYVLDLIAKTPVEEIHLFDGDGFLQHNAFRSPGAPSIEDLARYPTKVEWFAAAYSRMRRKIIPHPTYLTSGNVTELASMDFVFVCVDKGAARRDIVNFLLGQKIPFVDVGMGLNAQEGSLTGLVRTTTCTASHSDHLAQRIPFSDGEDNEYGQNIQIADMNALNAALAVIKWKKLSGFYLDLEKEHHTVYGVASNVLTNDEACDEKAESPT
ncbi:MAG: ThiF family adenylyltransferase [Nitrososphaerota archaeon]|nr:ThiF family adenylyltransferase [Nitrososphaerota archaeon]